MAQSARDLLLCRECSALLLAAQPGVTIEHVMLASCYVATQNPTFMLA